MKSLEALIQIAREEVTRRLPVGISCSRWAIQDALLTSTDHGTDFDTFCEALAKNILDENRKGNKWKTKKELEK